MLTTFDEDLNPLQVTVRVGQVRSGLMTRPQGEQSGHIFFAFPSALFASNLNQIMMVIGAAHMFEVMLLQYAPP
jgi:hypothetical protein